MASAGLRRIGVLLLLNLATETRGHSYSHPIDVAYSFGNALDICLYTYSTTVEFHKIKYGSLDTYTRRNVLAALLQCMPTFSFTPTDGSIKEPLDCFKYANKQDVKYSILYFENNACVFSESIIPELFLDCPDPGWATTVIYTSDAAEFVTLEQFLKDAEPIDSCSIEISDSTAKIEVSDSGSCKSDLYSVKFLFDGTEREETIVNNMEIPFDADIPQCTLVNVTISRLLVAGVPLGSDTCETAVITDPAEAELVENENDIVLITEPCEFLHYYIQSRKLTAGLREGPYPVDGIPVSFLKEEIGFDFSIIFDSDFNIYVRSPLVYIPSF